MTNLEPFDIDETTKTALRIRLKTIQNQLERATTIKEYKLIHLKSEQQIEKLRFFVDIMQGYQFIVEIVDAEIKNLEKSQQDTPNGDKPPC